MRLTAWLLIAFLAAVAVLAHTNAPSDTVDVSTPAEPALPVGEELLQALEGRWLMAGADRTLEFWPSGQFTEVVGDTQSYGVWSIEEEPGAAWLDLDIGRIYENGGFRDDDHQQRGQITQLDDEALVVVIGEETRRYSR